MKKTSNLGITLVALVITIIVLIILAGVTIVLLTSREGIALRAKEAEFKIDVKSIEEQLELARLDDKIDNLIYDFLITSSTSRLIENEINGLTYGIDNNFSQIENPLSNMTGNLGYLYELTFQAMNMKVSESTIQQFNDIKSETNNIALENSFDGSMANGNGKTILLGTDLYNQGTIYYEIEDLTLQGLNISDIDISSVSNATIANHKIGEAMMKISEVRSTIASLLSNYYVDYYNVIGSSMDEIKNLINETNVDYHAVEIEIKDITKESINHILNIANRIKYICSQVDIAEEDKKSLQIEIDILLDEIDRIAKYTSIGGVKILNGTFSRIFDMQLSNLGQNGNMLIINILTEEQRITSLNSIQRVINIVTSQRNKIDSLDIIVIGSKELKIDIPKKYKDKLLIIGGELVYIGTDEKEKQWIAEMGITTQ